MEILREPELNIGNITEADIYEEIYNLALSSQNERVQLDAWLELAKYKKDIESREERKNSMSDLLSSMIKTYTL